MSDEAPQPSFLLRLSDALRRMANAGLSPVALTDMTGLLFLDRTGVVVGANDYFLKMSGYSRADMDRGELHWKQTIPVEWLEETERQLQQCATTGCIPPYEREYLRKDGSRGCLLVAGSNLGNGMIAKIVVDIDQRKHAEAALRASEEQLAAELVNMQVLQTISGQLVRELDPSSVSRSSLMLPPNRYDQMRRACRHTIGRERS
jgi:PAS domain S-box-containing protein